MKTSTIFFAVFAICIASCTPDEPVTLPTLTTDQALNIRQTEAEVIGIVVTDGNATLLSYGVVVDITSGPDLTRSTYFDAGEPRIGSYGTTLSRLLPNTTYYVRTVATNSAGAGYGNEIQFVTLPDVTPIIAVSLSEPATYSSAKIAVTLSTSGTAPILEYGIVYGKAINPTVADNKFTTKEGTGITTTLTELSDNTKYYARGYVLTRSGVSYGNPISFNTLARIFPTVQTSDATAVTVSSAQIPVNVSVAGSHPVTERGIVFGKGTGPTITTGTKMASGSGVGAVTLNLTGLQESTKYYVRAYATSDAGTSYGREVTFQTYTSALPTPYRGEWYDLSGTQVYIINNKEIITVPAYSYLYGPDNSITAISGGYRVTAARIGFSAATFLLTQGTNTNELSISSTVTIAKTMWKVVGRNVMDVRFGTGQAGLTWSSDNIWKEKNDQGVEQSWTYTEMSRSDWEMLLRRNDNVLFLINVDTKTISSVASGGGPFTLLYPITAMYAW